MSKRTWCTFGVSFVKDSALFGWTPFLIHGYDEKLKGDDCDTALLEMAKNNKLALIPNEGFSKDGIDDVKLRARAKNDHLQVRTPREFFSGRLHEVRAIDHFLAAFAKHAPRTIAKHPNPEVCAESLALMQSTYRHVLLGEINNGPPVRVTL